MAENWEEMDQEQEQEQEQSRQLLEQIYATFDPKDIDGFLNMYIGIIPMVATNIHDLDTFNVMNQVAQQKNASIDILKKKPVVISELADHQTRVDKLCKQIDDIAVRLAGYHYNSARLHFLQRSWKEALEHVHKAEKVLIQYESIYISVSFLSG